jgi:glycosyltransferase involved in cell wall biosynthesis
MNKIFVQIASYRDSQLPITIKDLLDNASHPENLVIAICRQYNPVDEFDNIDEYRDDPRFKIIDVLYNETKGVCWARHAIQQLYSGEKYTLQLDSHHRFIKNWDIELIKMVEDLQKEGYKKPLLTAYLPSFEPHNDPAGRAQQPWKMAFDRFIPEGAVFFKPNVINDWETKTLPVLGRFYSAHFCFTLGEFSTEVQHNPDYLFHGEEISIAARAYTWGYDIFHPHKMIAWHEYSRSYRPQVWGDDPLWDKKNIKSHLINRKLFGMDGLEQEGHDGPYGFGSIRTLRDYEKYAGIIFSNRSLQQYTIDDQYPPNPIIEDETEWLNSFSSVFKHCIDIHHSMTPEKDYDFWVVAIHGENDKTLHRQDINKQEIENYLRDPDGCSKIWREFNTSELPKYWVVWPHSESKGWLERITGDL